MVDSKQMLINSSKTKAMLVTGKRIPLKLDADVNQSLRLQIENTHINYVTSHKLLGVILDTNMSYEQHVAELLKKLSKLLGLFKHISLLNHSSVKPITKW